MVRWVRAAFVVMTLLVGAVFVAAPAASASYKKTCLYPGVFRDGSHVLSVDWNRDYIVDSCFGIAPDRTVWNSWRGSGDWYELPNGGRADEICNAYYTSHGLFDSFPTLFVVVNGQNGAKYIYSSQYNIHTRKWEKWEFTEHYVCILW